MADYAKHLSFIENSHEEMLETLIMWSNINSHSRNLPGLEKMLGHIEARFITLQQKAKIELSIECLELPQETIINSKGEQEKVSLGNVLRIRKMNRKAKIKVFLGGHMDTVFPVDSSFQEAKMLEDGILNGPGVADLKGGILVMCKALEALEKSPWAQKIGWEVLINPDEEIGSPGSQALLIESAKRNDFGLVYEPSLADGSLAYKRKGSGNFTTVIRGKAAHVGRAFDEGRSAMLAAAEFIQRLHALNDKHDGIILNVGNVEGGGPSNVVADLAIVHSNIRITETSDIETVEKEFNSIVDDINKQDGISIEIHGIFQRQPKIPDEKTKALFDAMIACAEELGQEIKTRDTGGCCDGNNLFAAGLANIDTLGVRGGDIHSDKEFVLTDSLVERAKLSALFLMKLANGEIIL